MRDDSCKAFYAFLKAQFSNIEEAKDFYRWWKNECKQELPFWHGFTLRAMAYHISMVLEGYEDNPETNGICTCYIDTKFGVDIYWCELDTTAPG